MVFPLGLEGFAGHIMSLYASVSLGFLSLSFREKQYCFQYMKHAWRRTVFLVSLGLSPVSYTHLTLPTILLV